MKEHDDMNARGMRGEADASGGRGDSIERGVGRELLLMRAGGRVFAVFSDEAGAVAEWTRPTPLPQAPPSVVGVVSVRGRIRTVLDPLALLDEEPTASPEGDSARARDSSDATRNLIVPLRGDEQLALAVEAVEHMIAPPFDEGSRRDKTAPPVRAAFQHDGSLVLLLDPSQLFEAAMRGTERRRPRMKT